MVMPVTIMSGRWRSPNNWALQRSILQHAWMSRVGLLIQIYALWISNYPQLTEDLLALGAAKRLAEREKQSFGVNVNLEL
nr:hypothetical protein [Novosphingobium lindaniclasticum]